MVVLPNSQEMCFLTRIVQTAPQNRGSQTNRVDRVGRGLDLICLSPDWSELVLAMVLCFLILMLLTEYVKFGKIVHNVVLSMVWLTTLLLMIHPKYLINIVSTITTYISHITCVHKNVC